MNSEEFDSEEDHDLNLLTSTQSTRSSGVKVYEHVPPRVDIDKFQADIPSMLCTQTTKSNYENNFKTTLSKYSN